MLRWLEVSRARLQIKQCRMCVPQTWAAERYWMARQCLSSGSHLSRLVTLLYPKRVAATLQHYLAYNVIESLSTTIEHFADADSKVADAIAEYPPGQNGIDGGGFKVTQVEPNYLQFVSTQQFFLCRSHAK